MNVFLYLKIRGYCSFLSVRIDVLKTTCMVGAKIAEIGGFIVYAESKNRLITRRRNQTNITKIF